jgi:hypothetical protein
MNRQEVLRVNPSVFVAYVFPGVLWTSFVDVIGNGQGETEISLDPAEWFPRARRLF